MQTRYERRKREMGSITTRKKIPFIHFHFEIQDKAETVAAAMMVVVVVAMIIHLQKSWFAGLKERL